jgi:hypothetical protein
LTQLRVCVPQLPQACVLVGNDEHALHAPAVHPKAHADPETH